MRPWSLPGNGMRLQVDNGALVVRGGFTHYPQRQEAWRFFPGDPSLPSRIVVLDGNGSLTFDVIDWLASQGVPLIRIDWKGKVQAVLGVSGYGADPKKVAEQLEAKRNGRALAIATDLIRAKIDNSIDTLKTAPCHRLEPG
jgi:CRISP-associated protein Cas1